ncbi:MBL fold metallo-hydrolase [Amphibacillus sp. Q70]|uniref:MBL fold metallo-hydrolase n=1 Tax=Amphibacillus sp. Q70 TaxID=3453416 RepID=UPI003F8503D8
MDTLINKVYELGNNNYCIKEADSTSCYLLVGKEKALLFDTAYGYEDIRPIIQQITDLPLVVVNSHGDPDHALGNYWFDEVFIHELDLGKLFQNDNPDIKKKAIDYRLNKKPELQGAIDEPSYLASTIKHVNYRFVREGDVFDLGQKSLEVIHLPGHSYGCIALLDQDNGDLFSGDMVTKHNIWYFLTNDEQAPFNMAYAAYDKLLRRKDEIGDIYPAHGPFPIQSDIITQLKKALADIKVNHQQDELFESFVGNGYKHYYKDTLIIYSKERLQEFIEED